MKKISCFLFTVLVLLSLNVTAQAARVSADLDKTTAQVQEEMRLTIRVMDVQGNVMAPRVQGIAGFDIFYSGRASHLSFINGQSSSSVEFNYVLLPQKAGSYTIPPIDIQAGGQNFRTEPITVQVTQGSATPSQATSAPSWNPPMQQPAQSNFPPYTPPAQPSQAPPQGQFQNEPPPPNSSPDENIYILARTNKTSAYPNEQILLTYSLYTRYDTRYEGFQDEPEVSGFWIEEFPMDQNVPKENVYVDGKRFIKADVKKYALFPTAPAEYTIKPGTLKASIRREAQRNGVFDEFFDDSFFSGGNFFSRREDLLLKPPPIQLQIKPFPEQGKPKSFQGAVGNFRLTSSVDKTNVKQDEPITMSLILEGEGNIETLTKPNVPEIEGFRTYDSDAKHQLFRTGDQIGGRKTFEIVFIPTKSGKMVIPALEFSFFNPASQSYQTLRTQEYSLNVEKSDQAFTLPPQLSQNETLKKDIELQKRDIRYIHENVQRSDSLQKINLINFILLIGNGLLTLLLLIVFLTQKRSDFYNSNIALKRRSQARTRAEKRLKKLNALMNEQTPGKDALYFDEVEKIMTQYLTDKLNLSTLGITRYDLERKLESILGQEDTLYREILDLYSRCDASRFAKEAVSREDKAKAQYILKEAIHRLEKIK